jgi:hypothetical protein
MERVEWQRGNEKRKIKEERGSGKVLSKKEEKEKEKSR